MTEPTLVVVHPEGEPPADVGPEADVELELLPGTGPPTGRRDVLGPGAPAGSPPSWAARHGRLVRAGSAAVLASVLVAAGVAVVREVSGPDLPVVTAAAPVLPPSDQPDAVPSWAPGVDGRPSSPVTVSLQARLTLRSGPGTTVRLLGVAGPGILATPGWEPVTVAPDGTARPQLITEVDCEQVPIPVPAGAYRLQVEIRDRSRRTSTGPVAAGAVGARLGELVQSGCGPWLARRHLTVVSAAARTAPLSAQSEVDLSIANTGDLPGRLESAADLAGPTVQVIGDPAGSDLARVRLVAHHTTVVHLRLTADRCDTIATLVANPLTRAAGEPVTTTELLALAADTAPAPDPAASGPESDEARMTRFYRLGMSGIVIAPPAVSAVLDAVSHLCADLAPVVTLVDAVHLDVARRRITVDLSFDLSPGRVSSVTLHSASADDDHAFVPLWTTLAGLVPDRSGVVRASLSYRPPAAAACPYADAWVPPIAVQVQVPVTGGVRTVRFTDQGFPTPDPTGLGVLCR